MSCEIKKVDVPDMTGFTLGEAVDVLKSAGITEITVRLTAPPRQVNEEFSSISRVVRQRTADGGITLELVVCNLKE